MKRFRETKLFVMALLCLLPLAVSRGDDCNGTSYDPATQGCCNDQVYDLATQTCCSNLVGQPYVFNGTTCPAYCIGGGNSGTYDPATQGCCNGVVYDLATQECCGNLVVPIGQCCSGLPFNPDTQECCTDGHIADKGWCDPPPMCNNLPFDPVTQECCGGVIVPLGHCCNGVEYDPSTQQCCGGVVVNPGQCCNNQPYDPSTQDCCGDGTVAAKDQCEWLSCGGLPFDRVTQECCGGVIVPLGQCCSGTPFLPEAYDCCGNGTLAPKGQCGWQDCNGTAYDPAIQGCCEGQLYALATQECCSGAVVLLGNCCGGTPIDPLLQGCCNNQPYDLLTQECCSGFVVPSGHCCAGVSFDPDWQGCCNGQIYTLDGNECCADGRVVPTGECDWLTCAGVPYDSSTHGCCNGQIYELASQECCGDGTVAAIGQCPLPPPTCGGVPYDSASQGCCNGQIYSLTSQCCMNGSVVNMTSMGQCPSVCGDNPYDPSFYTCCGTTVVSSGTGCCNGTPYDPATQECCGDGTVAPTGQCGWPVCGGQRYDPASGLSCCNGVTYDPSTQVCCDGTTLVDIGQCHPSFCNNVPFDPASYECCNGQIVTLGHCCGGQIFDPGTQGCGGGTTIYDPVTQDYCPDGRVVPKGQCDWPTCNGVPYDSMVNECCADGTLAPIGQCPTPPALCNGVPYDPSTQDCCGDGRIVPKGQCNWPTCNGQPYDPDMMDCCGSFTAPKGQCPTCGGAIYDNTVLGCCQGRTYSLADEDCCGDGTVVAKGMCRQPCGNTTYDPAHQACCYGQVYEISWQLTCCPEGTLVEVGQPCPVYCNGEQYDPMIYGCCGNTRYELSTNQECCYGELVPAGQCPPLTVTINSSCPPPCFVSTNQTIEVNASSSGALGTVTYSWSFGGATGSSTEGTGPITVAFNDTVAGSEVPVTVTATDTFQRGGGSVSRSTSTNITVTVPKVTILMDADSNGAINSDDENIKQNPGVIVFENCDNDDNDSTGKPDKDKSPAYSEKDLVALQLGISPSLNSGIVKLEATAGGSRIKLWSSSWKAIGTDVTLPKEWNLANESLPPSYLPLYVEGVQKSGTANDIELKLSYSNGGNPVSEDKIKITVVRRNLGVAVYRDMDFPVFGGINHAGLVTGYTGQRVKASLTNDVNWVVTEMTPNIGIRTVGLETFTQTTNPFHGYYTVPNLTEIKRNLILANAAGCLQRPLGWCMVNAIVPEAWNGTIATIQELRCDGLVEVCYELAGAEVWGRNGANYPIQNWTAEHNELGMNQPQTELSPVVQRGGVPNSPTRLILAVRFEPQTLP
jgi:hypothetical protein